MAETRPKPAGETHKPVSLLVDKLDATGRESFLVGDLNRNMISEIPDNDTRLLTNITDSYGLHQLINTPSNLLDVVFTNCLDNVVC